MRKNVFVSFETWFYCSYLKLAYVLECRVGLFINFIDLT